MFLRLLVLDDVVESVAIVEFWQLFHSFQFSFLEECLIFCFQFCVFFPLAHSLGFCVIVFVSEFFDSFVQHSNLIFSLAEFGHLKAKPLIVNLFHLSHLEEEFGLLFWLGELILKFKSVLSQFMSLFIHDPLNFSKLFKSFFFLFVFSDLDSQMNFGSFS